MEYVFVGGFFLKKRGNFLKKITLLNEESVSRSITRLCHEIIEQNNNLENTVLIGIHNRG
ncbi:MAG: bifunctional pyr operon transcriptional regulator/uracil phosphoribosyltransferase, partial [Candidatus Marinimicrobia bacterium]|nr:bifunctional pyr operon transcriptional regulator/uracil phosphoribosyltransferase [Candidatus Neomarinimicrobiota bacterium]